VATNNALFRFPEITLGILPGLGGCIVPYRKWPQGASLFHEMVCLAKPLFAKEAQGIGMVSALADDYHDLIQKAVEEVNRLEGNIPKIPEGKVDIPAVDIPDEPMSGKQPLSKEAVSITAKTLTAGAAAETLDEALEICYQGFGEIACTDAAKEGVSAFLQKRRPEFKK
jgi:enoyl-CoA hydratase/3-hydroxyacyl-CoA dehydrogenase